MQAYYDALQASAVAKAWYAELCQLIHAGTLQLHTPYHGLQIVSIFDAKPVAFRAKPVRQYRINKPIPDLLPIDLPEDKPVILGYYDAVENERQAWSIFNAQYCQAILDWLKNPDDRFQKVSHDIHAVVNHFRTWEVKKC